MIIGLTGKKRSGKDTSARLFKAKGFIHLELANPLKLWLKNIDPVLPIPDIKFSNIKILTYYFIIMMVFRRIPRYSDMLHYKDYDLLKDEFPYIRMLLQQTGTDLVLSREKNFWVNIVINEIRKYPENTNFVISDIRFDHEVEALKYVWDNVYILGINREVAEDINSNHISESGINPHYIDYKINNDGTVVDLYNNLQKFLDVFNLN